jgi:O-Antigen ligase
MVLLMNAQGIKKNISASQHLILSLLPQPVTAWIPIIGFILVSVILLAMGMGKILNFVFPGLALIVGLYLFTKHSILYIGFAWWMWFLSPLVRRLADYRSGFTDPSPILLAPYLVSLVTIVAIFQYSPSFKRPPSIIFLLAFLSVFYGYLMGVLKDGSILTTVSVKFLDWLVPISFSYYLYVSWRQYPLYRSIMQKIFPVAVLISGIYGIYQYMVAPEWDCAWLINTELMSMGTPEPQKIRVWSTMHGSGVFAVVMMSGLLMLMNGRGFLYLPTIGVGYLAFLLSSVRAAWVGWIVGLVSLIASFSSSSRIRLGVIICAIALCVVPLATVEPFATVINERIATFSDLKNDGSGAGRLEIYQNSFNDAALNPLGYGIGNTHSFDSGILMIGATLGWIGGIPYFGSLLLLIFQVVKSQKNVNDLFAKSSESISLAMLSQLGFGPNSLGLPGMLLWGFLGIALAAKQYNSSMRSTASENTQLNDA